MFGLFKSAEKKCCDEVGRTIHRQITSILDDGEKVITNPQQMVFFAGYLRGLLWGNADNKGLRGDWVLSDEYIKYVCDGVTPKLFWDIHQRAAGLMELGDHAPFDVKQIYDLGSSAGIDDSLSSLNVANKLYLYLSSRIAELEIQGDLIQKDFDLKDVEPASNAKSSKRVRNLISTKGYNFGDPSKGYYKVIHWYFEEGDWVEAGQNLVDIESESWISTLAAEVSGVLTSIYVHENKKFKSCSDLGEIHSDENH